MSCASPAVLLGLLILCSAQGAASAAHLQWSIRGDYVNFPFSSRFPPYVTRFEGDTTDRIIMVTNSSSEGWMLTAFNAASGDANWTATVASPGGGNGIAPSALTSGMPLSQQFTNTLSTLFVQMGDSIVAVDPADGRQMWQHTAFNGSVPAITGHSGPATGSVVYLTSAAWDTSKFVPTAINTIEALDGASGELLWRNSTAPPPNSGLPASDTAAASGMTAAPGLAVFAQGPRLYGLAASDGKQLWSATVTAGVSTGLSANVTSVTYVEPSLPSRPHGLLLLQSTTWDQMRFMGYILNGSAPTDPPAPLWGMGGQQNFEGSLNEELTRLGLAAPQVDALDNLFLFWSNRTTYDPVSGKPVYGLWLVARSTETGQEKWARKMVDLGLGTLPVSPPIIHSGVVAFVTDQGLSVWEADSASLRFAQEAVPMLAQSGGGPYSYVPTTTFSDRIGQLAVVRCLGSTEPGSLCVYAGYEQRPSAAWRQRPLAAAHAVLAAALAAMAALLML